MKNSEEQSIRILAIESSCDDTSCAVIVDGNMRSNVVSSQTVHEKYGGVVPELASRAHLSHIVPVVESALKEAGLQLDELDAFAFTQGPGLLGSLIVGAQFAKGLAVSKDKPLIAVNHMEAHILAHFIEDPKPKFPFLNLTVSGGHTELVLMESPLEQRLIGQTLDDAAGEAFDKCGKMLGLSYPSGPLVDKYAREGKVSYKFPESRVPDFNFSFSGLKTAVLYFLRDRVKEEPDFIEENLPDLAASIQHAIVKTLVTKTMAAAKKYKPSQVAVSGGVSVNSALRKEMTKTCGEKDMELFLARPEYCTDNAAMIAMTAHFKYLASDFAPLTSTPDPRLKRVVASGL
jgi:N6-L-threonylcarbamoyladenine synthase